MSTKIIISVLILAFSAFSLKAQVAINTDNTTANSSAMLDVKSTSKGILIPRMTTAQRTAISSPANGLMVYDDTTNSFWFYDSDNSGWTELVTTAGAGELNDLSDVIYDGSSIFVGNGSGANDDGSNYNIALGKLALNENVGGGCNLALGFESANENTSGGNNVAIGCGTAKYNVTGSENTIVGSQAGIGSYGTSYSGSVLLGFTAGLNNSDDNKLFIDNSSTSTPLIGGDFSTDQVDINGTLKITGGTPGLGKILTSDAIGLASWVTPSTSITELNDLSDAIYDGSSVFVGNGSGANDDGTANENTALGKNTLAVNTSGSRNVAIGAKSLYDNISGSSNTSIGVWALASNTTGNSNVALGFSSLVYNSGGTNNVAMGYQASRYNSSGDYNISIGTNSLHSNQSGSNNITIGHNAGFGSSGQNISGCVIIGNEAGKNNLNSNKLFIDNSDTSTPLIGGDFSTNQLNINGTIKITGGSPGIDKVLTSDSNGLASWGENNVDGLSNGRSIDFSYYIGDQAGDNDVGSFSSWGTVYTENVGMGFRSLNSSTTGNKISAIGSYAAQFNINGYDNTAIGYKSLQYNESGDFNTAIGNYAGQGSSGVSFDGCVFIGNEAGKGNSSSNKLFIDNSSTSSPLIGGDFSTNQLDINGTIKITGGTPGANKVLTSDAVGLASWVAPAVYASSIDDLSDAILSGTKMFMGTNAGANNAGTYNIGIGYEALKLNTSGTHNTAMGYKSLDANLDGGTNSAFGHSSLSANTSGDGNTAVGYNTLSSNTTGNYNTAIGHTAFSTGTYSNSTAIGYGSSISGNNQIHLGNTSISEIKGQVSFTQYSDGRVKNQVSENVPGLDFIIRLRPVTYHFDIEKENEIMGISNTAITDHSEIDSIRFTGFIAQEVEQAANDCNYNFSGVKKPKSERELYGLSYSEFVVPLVKAIQEQQAIIEAQQKALIKMEKRLTELEANQSNAQR